MSNNNDIDEINEQLRKDNAEMVDYAIKLVLFVFAVFGLGLIWIRL